MNKIYIHYGHTEFKPELFKSIVNEPYFTKPMGGFWASPVDAKNGWRDWCEAEDFRECNDNNCFRFTIAPDARILKLTSERDLVNLPHLGVQRFGRDNTHYLNFEKLLASGIDGVEIELGNGLYWALYGWDVDSIVVLNPKIIVPVEEEKIND